MVTPWSLRRHLRRTRAALAAAVPSGGPVEIWLPVNELDGRGPGRYPIGGGPGVIVILADDDPRWDEPMSITPRPGA